MLGQSKLRPSIARTLIRAVIALILSQGASLALAQRAPVSPDHVWHGPGEAGVAPDAKNFAETKLNFDPGKAYSLPELIDLAESHNPETRVAWERARAQAAAWGVARSELYPALSAVALSAVDRAEAGLGSEFYRQTVPVFQISLD